MNLTDTYDRRAALASVSCWSWYGCSCKYTPFKARDLGCRGTNEDISRHNELDYSILVQANKLQCGSEKGRFLGKRPPWPPALQRLYSLELAIDNANNQQNQHRYDRNRYNPICSHPVERTN